MQKRGVLGTCRSPRHTCLLRSGRIQAAAKYLALALAEAVGAVLFMYSAYLLRQHGALCSPESIAGWVC